jgi:predicted small lipoprotein YifL
VIPAAKPVFAARALVLVLAVGLALVASGCGRKGPLEPPPNPSATPTPDGDTGAPSRHKVQPITPPKTPFVMDPLL